MNKTDQREPVKEGEVAACVTELRAVAGWSYGKRTFTAINSAADLLERTEAARVAAEKENQKLITGLAEISQLHFKDVADLKDQLTKENKARLAVITLANTAEENFKKELTTVRARSEKLVEAISMAFMGPFGYKAEEVTAALAAYQSSKENK